VIAALAIFALTIALWVAYNAAPPRVAEVVIFGYAAGLLLGPIVSYCLARRVASARRALAFGLAIPAFWLVKEMARVSAVFSVPETLFYSLSPVSLGILSAALVPIAVAEILFRRRSEGRWRLGGAPGVVLGVFTVLAVGSAVVGYGSGGNEIFFRYIALYRILFGAA